MAQMLYLLCRWIKQYCCLDSRVHRGGQYHEPHPHHRGQRRHPLLQGLQAPASPVDRLGNIQGHALCKEMGEGGGGGGGDRKKMARELKEKWEYHRKIEVNVV